MKVVAQVRSSIAELKEELRRAQGQLRASTEDSPGFDAPPSDGRRPFEDWALSEPAASRDESAEAEEDAAPGEGDMEAWPVGDDNEEFIGDLCATLAGAQAFAGLAAQPVASTGHSSRHPVNPAEPPASAAAMAGECRPPLGVAAGGGVAAVRRKASRTSVGSVPQDIGFSRRLILHERRGPSEKPRRRARSVSRLCGASPEEDVLAQAEQLTKMTLEEIGQSNKEISRMFDQTQAKARDLRSTQGGARSKLASTAAACGRTAAGVRNLDATFREVEDGLAQLQRVRYARWADLAIVERRLELLEGRPLEDLASNDGIIQALESERQVLIQAREAFLENEEVLRSVLVELRSASQGLRSETQTRRAACRADQATIRCGLYDLAHAAATHPARLSQTAFKMEQEVTSAPEETSDYAARFVDALVRDASKAWHGVESVLHWASQACPEASERTRATLAKALAGKAQMRRNLDEQIKKVDYSIFAAQVSLTRMAKWLDPATGQCSDRYERTAAMLQELQSCRRKLHDMMQRSSRATQTIEACRRVTPAAAAAAIVGTSSGPLAATEPVVAAAPAPAAAQPSCRGECGAPSADVGRPTSASGSLSRSAAPRPGTAYAGRVWRAATAVAQGPDYVDPALQPLAEPAQHDPWRPHAMAGAGPCATHWLAAAAADRAEVA